MLPQSKHTVKHKIQSRETTVLPQSKRTVKHKIQSRGTTVPPHANTQSNKASKQKSKSTNQVAFTSYLTSSSSSTHYDSLWDSGATHGISGNIHLFKNLHKSKITQVRGISGKYIPVNLAGTCQGMDNVLYIPSCKQQIISASQFLDQNRGKLEFTTESIHWITKGKRIQVGKRSSRGLYKTCITKQDIDKIFPKTANINLSIQSQLLRERVTHLHRTLGHASKGKMRRVLRRNNFTNLKEKDLELLLPCAACQSGKIKRINRNRTNRRRATKFGHTLCSDTSSKQMVLTRGNKQYLNVTVDEATRWVFVKLLKRIKHTAEFALIPLLKRLSPDAKILRTDQGTEFQNNEIKDALFKLGITKETACSDNQYQNGLAERKIGTLFQMTRTILADSKLPINFWGEAIHFSAFLINRLPNKANDCGASAYELRYNKLPNLNRLKPFGTPCTVLKHRNSRGKSKARTRGIKGLLVGYGDDVNGEKGWRIYIPTANKIVTSPNVIFGPEPTASTSLRPPHHIANSDDDISTLNGTPATDNSSTTDGFSKVNGSENESDSNGHANGDFNGGLTEHHINQPEQSPAAQIPKTANQKDKSQSKQSLAAQKTKTINHETNNHSTDESTNQKPPSKSEKITFVDEHSDQPKGWKVYPEDHPFFNSPGLFDSPANGGSTFKEGLRRSSRLKQQYVRSNNTALTNMFAPYHDFSQTAFEAAAYLELANNPFAADIHVPTSYKDAISGEHSAQWIAAIESEIQSLIDLKVFKLVHRKELPPGTNIIKAKWVFKVKPNKLGHVERYKTRLCAKGYLQKHGIDYSQTFSPVAKSESIKITLAIAAKRKLKLRSSDISTAFLFGELPESETVGV